MDSSIAQSSPALADTLLQQGLAASQADEGEQAIGLFARAAEAAPGWGVPHFLIGSEHAAASRWEQAEAAFANAVLLAPQLHIARYQLGLLQFSSGRAALALVSWQPLLELPDADPLPHFVRGFAALAQDAFDEARQHYHAGLERNTGDTGNAALSSDVQKVLAGIDALHAAPQAEPAPPEDSDTGMAHVLLSNYQRQTH